MSLFHSACRRELRPSSSFVVPAIPRPFPPSLPHSSSFAPPPTIPVLFTPSFPWFDPKELTTAQINVKVHFVRCWVGIGAHLREGCGPWRGRRRALEHGVGEAIPDVLYPSHGKTCVLTDKYLAGAGYRASLRLRRPAAVLRQSAAATTLSPCPKSSFHASPTSLAIEEWQSHIPITFFNAWLSRAGNLPLSLVLRRHPSPADRDSKYAAASAIELLEQHAQTWRDVTLSDFGLFRSDLDLLMLEQLDILTPELQRVSIP
ncbi:hypothetical protein C8J57DRAFT_1527260 [Mycena rebaudengoi]|nr:hypothetical protein C8J57DRAFT_1527260 [Mycena rebaudengoi]